MEYFGFSSQSLADAITCPHLLAQLRGLEASIDQTKRAAYTTLDYTEQLLITFGLMHITRFDRDQVRLIAELHGQTAFLDPRFPSTPPSSFPVPLTSSPPPPLPRPFTTTSTPTTGPGSLVVTTPLRFYSTTTVPRPATTLLTTTRSRSRSPLNPGRFHPVSTRRSTKKKIHLVFIFVNTVLSTSCLQLISTLSLPDPWL